MTEPNEDKSDLLTEAEVAAALRRSTGTVKRLRLTGALRFIPGRPPMVAKADLDSYLEAVKVGGGKADAPSAEPKAASYKSIEDARAWAMKMKFKAQRAPRRVADT